MSGGAIFYDLYSPKDLKENRFQNNTANYGSSIGSYAFTLKMRNNPENPELNINSGELT